MADDDTCTCGCGALATVSDTAGGCECGCTCCRTSGSREDEIAELRRLLESVQDRLIQLEAR